MSAVIKERSTKTRRTYSDREKAEALATFDACGSLTETSRATGIPDSTLSVWVSGQAVMNADVPILRSGKQLDSVELSEKFDTIAHLATNHVIARLQDPKRANKTPMPHLMTAAGISVDKSQLLKGQPTAIIEERVQPHAVLVLMSNALGLAPTIDVSPEPSEMPVSPAVQITE